MVGAGGGWRARERAEQAAQAARGGWPDAPTAPVPQVSIVSGAQLANYATFLSAPEHAPLAILLTATSTAAGAVLTPALAAALLGASVPVDATGVAKSIAEVVLAPIAAGLAAGRWAPRSVAALRPALAAAALLDTCCCVGASLAANAAALAGPGGWAVLAPVVFFHWAAFALGHAAARLGPARGPDGLPLARCLCLTAGMQSSLLALLLATRFFAATPAVALVAGVSTVVMTLSGFGLVVLWGREGREGVRKGVGGGAAV